MADDTLHETEQQSTRRGIGAFFRRLANAFSRGEQAPAATDQSAVIDPPTEADLAVDVVQEDDQLSLEIDVTWDGDADDVDTETTASKATFEVYEDNHDEWRWRLVHDNGNIIADSAEGYDTKAGARTGLESVRKNAPGAYVDDQTRADLPVATDDGGSKATFEIFTDSEDGWRWRLVHDNGNIIADSGQAYASKQKTKQGMQSVKTNVTGAPVTKASAE